MKHLRPRRTERFLPTRQQKTFSPAPRLCCIYHSKHAGLAGLGWVRDRVPHQALHVVRCAQTLNDSRSNVGRKNVHLATQSGTNNLHATLNADTARTQNARYCCQVHERLLYSRAWCAGKSARATALQNIPGAQTSHTATWPLGGEGGGDILPRTEGKPNSFDEASRRTNYGIVVYQV